MAFPTLQTADTKNGTVVANSTSWTGTYPTNLASGDLIVVCVAADGVGADFASGSTSITGFSLVGSTRDTTSAVSLAVFAKISNGTETGTFTITVNSSEQGGWRAFRVSGWYGSGIGNITVPGVGNTDDVGLATFIAVGAGSGAPNPPSLDPTNWAAEDTLWLAAGAIDTSRTISAFSTSYINTASDVSGGAGGATLGTCWRSLNASAEDPSVWTTSASDDNCSVTVAIRPAAAAVAASYISGIFDRRTPRRRMIQRI